MSRFLHEEEVVERLVALVALEVERVLVALQVVANRDRFLPRAAFAGGDLLREIADALRQIRRNDDVGRELLVDVGVGRGGQNARVGRREIGPDAVAEAALALDEIVARKVVRVGAALNASVDAWV